MDLDMPKEKDAALASVAFTSLVCSTLDDLTPNVLIKDFHFVSAKAEEVPDD
jgi:hypothetical protein